MVHESDAHPFPHADRRVTDLDGHTTKEHSTDPRDMEFGNQVRRAVHEMRNEEDE